MAAVNDVIDVLKILYYTGPLLNLCFLLGVVSFQPRLVRRMPSHKLFLTEPREGCLFFQRDTLIFD